MDRESICRNDLERQVSFSHTYHAQRYTIMVNVLSSPTCMHAVGSAGYRAVSIRNTVSNTTDRRDYTTTQITMPPNNSMMHTAPHDPVTEASIVCLHLSYPAAEHQQMRSVIQPLLAVFVNQAENIGGEVERDGAAGRRCQGDPEAGSATSQ